MCTRPVCTVCRLRPCAINYHRDDRIFYRSKCELCLKDHSVKKLSKPLWQQQGYQKKNRCQRCGFHSNISQVFSVYVVDGNLRNITPPNLRTVCANCQILLSVTGEVWKNVDLISDF